MEQKLVRASGITKSFGNVNALNDVSFSVEDQGNRGRGHLRRAGDVLNGYALFGIPTHGRSACR